ncbi:MAG: hypothetical protein VYB80_05490, partial [Actinomycetota bacterium]|nr:hypothetical protein [Actinomycetota bacterium]
MSDIGIEELAPDKVGKVRNGITMMIIWLVNLPVMVVLWSLSGISKGGTILPAIILSIFTLIAPMCLYM